MFEGQRLAPEPCALQRLAQRNAQAVAKPQALDLQVALDEPPFFFKHDDVPVFLKRRPQQPRELLCGASSGLRLTGDQMHDGMQRIEEEMGMELRTERGQL